MKQTLVLEPETPQEWVDYYVERALKVKAQIRKEAKENGYAYTTTLRDLQDYVRMLGTHYLDLVESKKKV